MTRRVLISYLAVTAFVVVILAVPLGLTVARGERDRLVSDVERDATVLATLVEDALEHGEPRDLNDVATRYADRVGARAVVVDRDGVSLADSGQPEGPRRDFSTRPEIGAALDGRLTSGRRFSQTLDTGLLYVAVPVASGGQVHGAVRITYPTDAVDARIRGTWVALAAVGGVALVATAVVGLALARSVSRPVQQLHATAERLSAGDLSARAETTRGPAELRSLAATLNAMARRLSSLLDSQRAFVADASHQLRSPLTALRLRLEALEGLTPGQQQQVEAAMNEAGRLSRLIDGLLTLARAEGSQPPTEPVDVAACLTERAQAWDALSTEAGVTLSVDTPTATTASAVPGALEQIVDNYLANALEVAPAGSTVRLRSEVGDDRVVVSVEDAGPGMATEDRQRAFDRFWRGTSTDKEGFGLGLAIVARLAAASGGRAELRRGPNGRGTAAVVELPLASGPRPQPRGGHPREPGPVRGRA